MRICQWFGSQGALDIVAQQKTANELGDMSYLVSILHPALHCLGWSVDANGVTSSVACQPQPGGEAWWRPFRPLPLDESHNVSIFSNQLKADPGPPYEGKNGLERLVGMQCLVAKLAGVRGRRVVEEAL